MKLRAATGGLLLGGKKGGGGGEATSCFEYARTIEKRGDGAHATRGRACCVCRGERKEGGFVSGISSQAGRGEGRGGNTTLGINGIAIGGRRRKESRLDPGT